MSRTLHLDSYSHNVQAWCREISGEQEPFAHPVGFRCGICDKIGRAIGEALRLRVEDALQESESVGMKKCRPSRCSVGKKMCSRGCSRCACRIIVEILDDVDQRAMEVDGPVTPTRQEITDDELRRIYIFAKEGAGLKP